MKNLAKNVIVSILKWQVLRYLRTHPVKLIGVAGSIGKTSTKSAIATVLSEKYLVSFQSGNYNDHVTVPLVIFKQQNPETITDIWAWIKIFISNEQKLKRPLSEDVIILELGTDGEGQIQQFDYLNLDIGVLTAISEEHMANFANLDAVAREELTIANFSNKLLFNADLTGDYLEGQHTSFGLETGDYRFKNLTKQKNGFSFELWNKKAKLANATYNGVSKGELYSVLAATAAAHELGLTPKEIKSGLEKVTPFAGRMQILQGIKESVILDDSYNSSPKAVEQALDALYGAPSSHKIALLGNMNELGIFSKSAHEAIGSMCDPKKVDLVVTLGEDANNYTAPAAEQKGCNVIQAVTPYQAGEVIAKHITKGTTVLVKGSQNGVFAEEAIKSLLRNPKDSQKLVRQDKKWLEVKNNQFGV